MLLSSCTTSAPTNPLSSITSQQQQLYDSGLRDTRVVESWEITNKLNPVNIDNEGLIWQRIQGQDYVLVVTWAGSNISWAKNDPKTGFFNTGKYDNWVTLVPDVKRYCSDLKTDNLKLKLEQSLGLPPQGNKSNFVEYWVKPSDLFRPCPDPEIHDTSCQISHNKNVSESHNKWFELQNLEKDYPWTKLGYTYNWGSFGPHKIGFSEYIISKNSNVVVKQTHSTLEYCS